MGKSRESLTEAVHRALKKTPNANTSSIATAAGVNYNTARRIIGKIRAITGTSKHVSGQEARVMEALSNAGKPLTSTEIAIRSGVNRNTVRGIIVRLRGQMRIGKLGTNQYYLTE